MLRLTGEQIPSQSQGQFVPYVIGDMEHVATLAACAGQVNILAKDMTATSPGAGAWLQLSNRRPIENLGADSGTIQIGGERMTYTARNANTRQLRLGSRGSGGSTAVAHSEGDAVYEVLENAFYIVAENPLPHKHDAITRVYVDGILKEASDPPTHVVNMDDTDALSGRSLVTITFDLTTVTVVKPKRPLYEGFYNPVAVHPGSRGFLRGARGCVIPWRFALLWPRLRRYIRRWRRRWCGVPPIRGGSGFRGGGGGTSRQPGGWTWPFPIPTWNRQPPPPSTPPPPRGYPPPLMGNVTVDMTGLKDDASGTITGTANQLIEAPAHVTRLLLREAYDQTTAAWFDDAVWADTHTKQQAAGLTRWALRYIPLDIGTFREQVGLHGRADLYLQDGVWRYRYRERRAPTFTLTDRTMIRDATLHQQPVSAITTVLNTSFDLAPEEGSFTKASSGGLTQWGPWRARTLELPWIRSRAQAETLATYWLGQWDRPRLSLTCVTSWEALILEQTDVVLCDSPILEAFGGLTVYWEVRTVTWDADQHLVSLTLVDTDPASA